MPPSSPLPSRWRVRVYKPRKGEKSWRVIPRRRVNGKRQEGGELRASDEATAKQLARFYEARLNAGCELDADNPSMDALFALRIYDLSQSDASPNTVKAYEAARKAFVASLGGVGALDVTKGKLLQAQEQILKGRSQSTVALYLSQAAAVFRWAQDVDWIPAQLTWPRLGRRKAKRKKTKKRPWSDLEIARLLGWAADYQGGKWLGLIQVLADTGARIGAAVSLSERDLERGENPRITFSRQWVGGPTGGWRKLKTAEDEDDVRVVEIPRTTMDLLPQGNYHGLLWPNVRDPSRPSAPESMRDILKRASTALGIEDAHLLDTHSLRRAWVATARDLGIANKAGMAVTGHREEHIYLGYDRNGKVLSTRATVEAVNEKRRSAGLHPDSTAAPQLALAGKGLAQTQDLTSQQPCNDQPPSSPGDAEGGGVECCPPLSSPGRPPGDQIGWRLDPVVRQVAEWAGEHPEVG